MDGNKTRPAAANAVGREFVIERVFDAPRALVWKAHTECAHLKHWWGPKGAVMRVCNIDFRPGGIFHYCLRTSDGHDMWGKIMYREIAAPERLVFVVSFSDEQGGVTRHPMSPSWPIETLSTMIFAERDGKTTLAVRWAPHNATEQERKAFDAGHSSMTQGWTGTFDQLAAYLAMID
ncbi:MAG: SRPBCC domain-containing protein [Rhodospirillales bacterium]|nr:SRPBCC domain-containing protein [Rhodospirillales bacterium]